MCGCFILAWVGSMIVAVVSTILTIIVASTTSLTTTEAFALTIPIVTLLLLTTVGFHAYRSRD